MGNDYAEYVNSLVPGDPVVAVRTFCEEVPAVVHDKVQRVTPKQLVTDGGKKFFRGDHYRIGSGTGSGAYHFQITRPDRLDLLFQNFYFGKIEWKTVPDPDVDRCMAVLAPHRLELLEGLKAYRLPDTVVQQVVEIVFGKIPTASGEGADGGK